jgi:acetyl-CoA acetyltransferase
MSETGVTEEQIASVAVAQRKWAALNPRATLREPVSVADVLGSPNVCWPLRRSMCCLVSDAGGAIIVCASERARDFPKRPVYILGTGAAIETGVASPTGVGNPLQPGLISRAGRQAFASAGLSIADIDHLMIYDAFAHLPLFALEGLGFMEYGGAAGYIAAGNTAPGGSLPLNTNGGGLCYAHSGSYGMLCMQESIRQLRGEAAAQIAGLRTSLAHGWGGFWSACATIIFSNELTS